MNNMLQLQQKYKRNVSQNIVINSNELPDWPEHFNAPLPTFPLWVCLENESDNVVKLPPLIQLPSFWHRLLIFRKVIHKSFC